MITYIKLNVEGFYVELPEALDPKLYDNLGETFEDFLKNKWVPLSEEQVKFRNEHPEAQIEEVWDMSFEKPERTLYDAKTEKIGQIWAYDASENVNIFYVSEYPMWLDKATRAGLKLRFEAELAMGQTNTSLWYNRMEFPLATAEAVKMLYALEMYASACYDNTQRHLAAVESLETIEEVDKYDFTQNYPDKLTF